MQTALIVMTILGCDDNVTECHYVSTAQEHFVSVELCDAASERVLAGFTGVSYPMLVAVCQPPESQTAEIPAPPAGTANPTTDNAASTEAPSLPGPAATLPEEERQSLAARAVSKIRRVIPNTADIRMVFETPLHVVASSYSWVAKKISP
ncbi:MULTISPECIES: hypothetical protein [Alphaproteobacteria]|uniref:Uncharacterized protein n=2 Tax=Alphaproteobacteria TaxID=28211 RepID=A0A512HCP9_9HYPH|nr:MULTISPECIES: hypothetical protein [Alphaproteobacteria]GEO83237.1 hypothetical protein RNA01_01690 [Ciceribacter naphthalenivorans]GLR20368.1 hypothetical protein GCM10007920_01520 [Ciceribacter naphthalenivorans]GLT03224.1 hypothetical protein GCM10007926_01520 [Sphingomonas psychrolutea]